MLGEDWEQRKDFFSLEEQISKDTPPSFLWHTASDASVPAENSLLFLSGLRRYKIPVEFHLYEAGAHGMGTAGPLSMDAHGGGVQKECENWMELACNWLHRQWEF